MGTWSRAQIYEDLKMLRRRGNSADRQLPKSLTELLEFDVVKVSKISGMLERGDVDGVIHAIGREASSRISGQTSRKSGLPASDETWIRTLELQALADRVFGSEQKADAWLQRPNRAMAGQRPLDLMDDELGVAVVRESLEQIDHGIFA